MVERSAKPSKSPDNAETATTIPEKKHGTAFSFAVFHADRYAKETESYFSVRGEQRHGLLIDPGAASGLIGSETLRELMSRCVTLLGKNDEILFACCSGVCSVTRGLEMQGKIRLLKTGKHALLLSKPMLQRHLQCGVPIAFT